MRIPADENCDRLLVDALRQDGHDVVFVLESGRGSDDDTIFTRAVRDGRSVLTDDLDFGRLAAAVGAHPPSILLLRLAPLGRLARVGRVRDVLRSREADLAGHLAIIEPAQIRLRVLPRV